MLDHNQKVIKVLYICPNGFLGGAERFVVEANRGHLDNSLLETEILFLKNGAAVEKANEYAITSRVLQQSFRFSNPIALIKALIEIRKILIEGRYDIAHATMGYTQVLLGLAAWGLDLKRVWFQHGPIGSIWDYLGTLFLNHQIYSNSNYTLAEHNKIPAFQKAKEGQFIIPLGIEEKSVSQQDCSILRQEITNEDSFLILSAGRINRAKGYEKVIRSLAEFIKKNPMANVHLAIAGGASNEEEEIYRKELRSIVAELDLSRFVSFLGHIKNLSSYMKMADLFILGTLIPEGLGLVIAEAMLARTLVVASDEGGAGDILTHQKTGLCYRPTSENAVIDLFEIIENVYFKWAEVGEEAFSDIKNKAYSKIRSRYNCTEMEKSLYKHYLSLMSERA